MIHYVAVTTGSCGNSYAITTGEETILFDVGVTYTKLERVLRAHEITMDSVKAIFITHLHPDHSKGLGVIQRKDHIPAYMSDIAYEENKVVMEKQRIEMKEVKTFAFSDVIRIGEFTITPFRTFHDSPGSAGYSVTVRGRSFFLMTDTGIIPEGAEMMAADADVEFIESNYDINMLENGHYAASLKRRISGKYGHLSNADAVEFASRTARLGDNVYFVHLSKNNNTPELVRKEIEGSIRSGIFCKVCERGETFEGFIDEKEWEEREDNVQGM